jgi:hypothetical protein
MGINASSWSSRKAREAKILNRAPVTAENSKEICFYDISKEFQKLDPS